MASVPKLVDAKVIGSAYALIFWIQNIGLWLFPLLIGKVLDATNPAGASATELDYTAPLVMLACGCCSPRPRFHSESR